MVAVTRPMDPQLEETSTLVHLKDMAVKEGQPIFAEVGEGNLNWPAILAPVRKRE